MLFVFVFKLVLFYPCSYIMYLANEFHSECAIKPAVHYDFDMSADRLYMFIDQIYNGVLCLGV